MNTNMNTTRPTPETDAEARKCHGIPDGFNLPEFSYVTSAFASKLERERDEAREWQNVKVTKNGETHCLGTLIDLLERERDEALAKLSTVYRWIERNHSDGFIDSQSHLENLDRVADAWHDKLEDMQRELGKTRDQLKAMREAIKEAYEALTGCVDDSGELLAERGWWRDEPRCGYQARYEETKQRIEDAEAALTKLKLFIL